MGEQTPPVTPTEVERELAAEIVRHGQNGGRLVELVAVAVATARAAGHAEVRRETLMSGVQAIIAGELGELPSESRRAVVRWLEERRDS